MFRKFSSIVLFFLAVAALFAIFVHAEKGRADSSAASRPQTTDTKVIPCNRPLHYMPHD